MFVRAKKSGRYEYLQVVRNARVGAQIRQEVIATLGRVDVLQKTGELDALLSSCARFADKVAVLDAVREGRLAPAEALRTGPPLVFERLWLEAGLPRILHGLLADRRFEFPVERAVFLTVLHRLFEPGSDRAAEVWREGYALDGVEGMELHHLYRAMAWLGEELPAAEQSHATPFAPTCTRWSSPPSSTAKGTRCAASSGRGTRRTRRPSCPSSAGSGAASASARSASWPTAGW